MSIPHNYRAFATPRQIEVLEALEQEGSTRKAAAKLEITHGVVDRVLKAVRAKMALAGVSEEHDMVHAVPDPYVLKGVSTLYDEDGKVRAQWVKTKLDDERRLKIISEAIAEACESIPRLKALPAPKQLASELCNVYTMTDCHIGMKAWGKENQGQPWDLEIAEETLTRAFEHMVDNSPKAASCVIAQLGDFLHYDSLNAVTPTSGHILDADSRFSKMVSIAIRVLRRLVAKALEKHAKVTLVIAEGNHDMASSVWLRHMFKALYEKEPRVQVIDSEQPYYAYQHGKVMLCWHHSHLKNMESLPLLFATKYQKMWGDTDYRFAHTGDKHHAKELEYAGMTVTQHPTLASADAYAVRHGYMSVRRANAITYHADLGEVGRTTVNPDMFKKKANAKIKT